MHTETHAVWIVMSEAQMEQLGSKIAHSLLKHSIHEIIIFLTGNLGAGKTTFVRGFLRGLQYLGNVKSPTYTLVEPYELSDHKIFHFDFYRLIDPQELELMGIRDYFHAAYCLIEWPENAGDLIPHPDLQIEILIEGGSREVRLHARSDRGKDVVKTLNA